MNNIQRAVRAHGSAVAAATEAVENADHHLDAVEHAKNACWMAFQAARCVAGARDAADNDWLATSDYFADEAERCADVANLAAKRVREIVEPKP